MSGAATVKPVVVSSIDKRIAALTSWSGTHDRKTRAQPARDAFLARFGREVDPDGQLDPDERRQ